MRPRAYSESDIDDLVDASRAIIHSPEAMAEMLRMVDLALDNVEMSRNALGETRSLLAELDDEALALQDGAEFEPTVVPENLAAPSAAPLPAIFFDDDGTFGGPLAPRSVSDTLHELGLAC